MPVLFSFYFSPFLLFFFKATKYPPRARPPSNRVEWGRLRHSATAYHRGCREDTKSPQITIRPEVSYKRLWQRNFWSRLIASTHPRDRASHSAWAVRPLTLNTQHARGSARALFVAVVGQGPAEVYERAVSRFEVALHPKHAVPRTTG